MWEHLFRHLDRFGNVKQATFKPLDGWRLNRAYYGGGIQFQLNPDRVDVEVWEEMDSIQHWWRNVALGVVSAGGGFVHHATYIFRERQVETDDQGVTSWTGFGYAPWSLLNQRRVMFAEKVAGTTLFEGVGVFEIAYALIEKNTSNAVNRWRDGTLGAYEVTVAAPGVAGPLGNLQARGDAVGDVVARLMDGRAAHVKLLQTTNTNFVVQYAAPYYGSDKSGSVIFSLKRNNMRRPRLRSRSLGRPTVGVGLGTADGDTRVLSDVREGPDFEVWRDGEGVVDLRDVEVKAQLNGEVDRWLVAARPSDEFDFEPTQTADTFYSGGADVAGRNVYDLGDVVLADYYGQRLREVTEVEVRGGSVTEIVVTTQEVVS